MATEVPGVERHIYAATYGEPPDLPATTALLAALAEAATTVTSSSPGRLEKGLAPEHADALRGWLGPYGVVVDSVNVSVFA
ncbi:hypothetical protein [Candidatus Solirubrobacter pratensis]|uniref:hypothetical protein n=1 Tax=Candidatus Solirubrobacter pratensis TaxID=1298857 RepID=UPI0005646046|nr:hypothetical protein [Candidatus Solirubrobacter pratensis]